MMRKRMIKNNCGNESDMKLGQEKRG